MRHAKILTLIACVSALTACGGSKRSADPEQIDLRPPEESVMRPCDLASQLAGPMTQAETETAWRADRVALAACRGRHAALVEWVRGTTEALNGERE